ncbi:MAG: hypothetical protein KatS3mg043_1394 [Rhodothermaceae bacterium]|nr:MAG: hypothetical protein KatS3mg043_1394 [Rhodothermaceae bacterium]
MAETETQQNVAYVTPLVGELLLPVSESSPTGRDVSYEDDFQALKAEVDLISSPTGEADFERIVSLAQLVLREQSKDLVTAGYLTVGLMQTRGVAGLAEGWSVVQGLLERYWEGLYPGKAVRRRNALQFLSDRSREYLERLRERKPSVEERGALEGALLAVRSVQGFAMEALGDQAPALSGLVSLLNERLRRVPEPEPAAGEGPGPGETEGAPASDPEAGAAPPAAPEPATAASGDDAGADGFSSPLVGELLLPVSESSPTGRDVSYEDDFQALKAEVDLISSPTGEADFERIVSLAQLVLREQSKDLVTAGYLTVGLMQTRGVAGLAEGWSVVQGLLERYWEGLYPGKAVRRRNALQFLSDRSREYLERLRERKPSVEERGALEGALLAVRSVQGFAMEALGDQAPALSGLVSLLNERLRRVPEPEPEPEAPPASRPAPPAGTPAAPAAAPPAAAGAPAEIKAATDAESAVLKAIGFLRNDNPKNPLPYRLLRVLYWSKIPSGPAP